MCEASRAHTLHYYSNLIIKHLIKIELMLCSGNGRSSEC